MWSLSWGLHTYPTFIGHSPVLEAQVPKFSIICPEKEHKQELPVCVSGESSILQKLGPCTPCDTLM